MASSRKKRRLVLAAVPFAMLGSLVACNNIIGLTDFTKGECPGARCGTSEGGPDQFVPDGGNDTGTDGSFDAQGTPPAVWAQWHMPNYGEGGAGEPPFPLSYGDAGTVVIDKVTGLNWQRSPLADGVLPTDADAKCEAAHGAGWRAPKRVELVTLLDYGKTSAPFADTNRFAILQEVLITTSPVRNPDKTLVPGTYWAVSFFDGRVIKTNQPGRVLCLKGS